MYTPRRSIRKAWLAMLGLALFASTGAALADDPPDRVARLSFLRGEVSFQPAGGDEWTQASLNRPLGTGDRIYTDRDARTEMEIGAATLRLDQQSSFDLLNLDDNVAQVELTEGVLNLHVRRVFEGQTYEVDTPTLAFVINQPGDYRIDIAPDGSSSMITVFTGAGDVYGENNASYSVRAGQSYRFRDSSLTDYEVLDLPRPDDFDGWVDTRINRYQNSPSRSYVSEDVIGYADLDDYGGWSDVPEYGNVWYPTTVEAGWAPYRSGHWAWIDPWGWTWVDNNAWGFAPFHYGRWAYVGNRWGWCPGPVNVRPIYAPALVGFVGGAGWGIGVNVGGPVGWFPLGPRDVYVPWYGASRGYFTNINVRNTTVINNVNITNVYNNYSAGRPINNANYAYRQNTAAVTAVSREAFVGARAVNTSRVKINEAQLRNANVVSRVGIAPERASFVGANAARARAPSAQALDRKVIARTAPPARTVPVAQRIDAIKRNGDQPLTNPQLRQAAARTTGTAANRNAPAQRVQVVGNNASKPQPLPARAPGNAANPATRVGANDRANPAATRTAPTKPATTTPNARTQPQKEQTQRNAPANTSQRNAPASTAQPNALPSSRFAPRTGQTTPADRSSPTSAKPSSPSSTKPANTRQTAPSSNERTAPSSTSRSQPPSSKNDSVPSSSRQTTPRSTESNVPQGRSVPQNRTAPQSAPVERKTTPPPTTQRAAPTSTQRSATSPSYKPPQQQQRSAPPPQQQRSAPPPQQQRSAPPPQQQRSAPPPQQQRNAPPVQQQPRQQPQRAPPKERTQEEKDKDKDGRSR
jgi:hypothetical protein